MPQVGITNRLISVGAQNDSTWTERTADISEYIGTTVRLVILYQSGTSYTGDVQLDDFNIGGNTFSDFSASQNFQTNDTADNTQISSGSLDSIQSDYDAVTFESVGTSTVEYGKWVRDGGGTPSASTGNTAGNTGSFYLYAETSSVGSDNDIWLRSPEVTVNNSTLSFYSAQNGATCGPIYAYLDVVSVDYRAIYGQGRYGTARYGIVPVRIVGVSATGEIETLSAGGFEVDVTERITAGVSATGAIGSPEIQATDLVTGVQGTTALGTVSVNIQEDVTGVQGTTALGTTLVNIQEDILGVSATGTVGSVTLSNTVTLTGVSATGTVSPASDIRVGKTVRGWSAPSAITGSIGTLVLKATSNFTLTGVAGTGQIGTLSPNLSVPISSVLGTGTVESVSVNSFEIDVSERLSGVEGTGQIGTISPGVAVPISGVSGTGDVSGVALSADSLVVPSGVSATGQITAVAPNVSESITGVEGELNSLINLTVTGAASTTLTGVSATGFVNTVEEKPTEALLSVSATGSIGSVRQNPGAGLTGVAGTTVINLPAPSDAITVFDATTFSRIRTVILQPKEITPNRRAA